MKLPVSAKPLLDFLALMTIFTVLLWLFVSTVGLGSHSVFYAWVVAASNAVVGYVLFEYGYAIKSPNFLRVALLGQGVRLLLVVAAIAALVLLRAVERELFVWSMLGFYGFYLPIEVLACLNKMKIEKRLEKLEKLSQL